MKIAIIFLLILTGCASGSKDEFVDSFKQVSTIELHSSPIRLQRDSIHLSYMFEMLVWDSLLIINDFPDPHYCMKIVDLRTGIVRNFGKKGRGPGELQSESCNFSIESSSNSLFVSDRLNYYQYSFENLKSNFDRPVSRFLCRPEETSFLNSTYSNGYVIGGTIKNKVGVYDVNARQLSCKHDYQFGPLVEQANYYNHPSKKRVVYFLSKAAAMGIVEVGNNDITDKEVVWWEPSQNETIGDNGEIRMLPKNEERNGFITAAVTEKYIYALYSGKVLDRKSIESLSSAFLSQCVYVFDWQGKPVKRYLLDSEVRSIAVDAKDQILYAASYENEPHLVEYKL